MNKFKIESGEWADFEKVDGVCFHLKPIKDYLLGASFPNSKLIRHEDPHNGPYFVYNLEINFSELGSKFEFPDFVKLNPEKGSIFCVRCWSSISGKTSETSSRPA